MSGGTVGPVDEAQLDALVGRYEWFTPARILRVLQTGRSDRRVSIAAVSRLLPLGRFTVDREALCALSPADLIDRFLKEHWITLIFRWKRERSTLWSVKMEPVNLP